MKKNIILFFILLLGAVPVKSQSVMPPANIEPVLENLIRSYSPWVSAEFNGKLKYDKLPFSPTIKMYMVRDSLIQISVRAVLLGEVARIEMTPQRLTVINKMNKTYCSEPTDNLLDMYPVIISDIQNIFLARVTILGSGELGYDNAGIVTVKADGNNGWMLLPQTDGLLGLRYGYLIGQNSRTNALEALLPGVLDLEVLYSYANKGMQMDIQASAKKKKYSAALDFTSVKWGGSPMSPVKLQNYRQKGINDFIASF